eukprot:TRINITY_DN18679_c0_g1::TRINITY_DN18679_c0_g1_i1::g.20474::m.20474 TRINITY_DN18679_c0_g1::TRINITY_DN18679_c0_g1_i1::g.20474  ORF type:complete len:148 (-),score=7.46 TRINITY_DN18679_c0_g1_i1:563-964(-)
MATLWSFVRNASISLRRSVYTSTLEHQPSSKTAIPQFQSPHNILPSQSIPHSVLTTLYPEMTHQLPQSSHEVLYAGPKNGRWRKCDYLDRRWKRSYHIPALFGVKQLNINRRKRFGRYSSVKNSLYDEFAKRK